MLGDLLGGGASSPLFLNVREQHGLAYRIDAWVEGYDDAGVLLVAAGVGSRRLPAFLDRTCETLLAVADRVSSDDLERTHNQRIMQLAQRHERPMELVEAIAQDLVTYGRVKTPDERIVAAAAIDAEQLATAARTLVTRPATLALVGRTGRGDHLAAIGRRLGAPRTAAS